MPERDYNRVFQTAEVAAAIRVPEWRIIKFVQGKEYRIHPSVGDAKGTGTRRLYSIFDVYKMGLGYKLLKDGFRPQVVGSVVERLFNKVIMNLVPLGSSHDADRPRYTKPEWERFVKMYSTMEDACMEAFVKGRKDRILVLSFAPPGRERTVGASRKSRKSDPGLEHTMVFVANRPGETALYDLGFKRGRAVRSEQSEMNVYFIWIDRLLNQIDDRIWGKKTRS